MGVFGKGKGGGGRPSFLIAFHYMKPACTPGVKCGSGLALCSICFSDVALLEH